MPDVGQQLELAPVAAEDLQEAILGEVAACLIVFAQGRSRAITGRRLAGLVAQGLAGRGFEYQGKPASLARRCRAAIAELVRQGHRIGSSSGEPRGYFHANDLVELEDGARTLRQHLIGTARRLRAYDRATGDAVLQLLGQEALPLAKPVTTEGEGT